jgi:hypothetical protein
MQVLVITQNELALSCFALEASACVGKEIEGGCWLVRLRFLDPFSLGPKATMPGTLEQALEPCWQPGKLAWLFIAATWIF